MSAPTEDLFAVPGVTTKRTEDMASVIVVGMTYSEEDDGRWHVRVKGVGLIATIDRYEGGPPKVTRYKDEWWSTMLSDEYLVARLALRFPDVFKRAKR